MQAPTEYRGVIGHRIYRGRLCAEESKTCWHVLGLSMDATLFSFVTIDFYLPGVGKQLSVLCMLHSFNNNKPGQQIRRLKAYCQLCIPCLVHNCTLQFLSVAFLSGDPLIIAYCPNIYAFGKGVTI